MTKQEKAAIKVVIKVLMAKRNRFGKIEPDHETSNQLRELARSFTGNLAFPHGGLDSTDQCSMTLQALIGDKPVSVLEVGD